jgi:hypothetical protein
LSFDATRELIIIFKLYITAYLINEILAYSYF